MGDITNIIEIDVRRDLNIINKIKDMDSVLAAKLYARCKDEYVPSFLIRQTMRKIPYSELSLDGLRFVAFMSKKMPPVHKANAMAAIIIRCESDDELDIFSTNKEVFDDAMFDWKKDIELTKAKFIETHHDKLVELNLIEPSAPVEITVDVMVPVEDVITEVATQPIEKDDDICNKCKEKFSVHGCSSDECNGDW